MTTICPNCKREDTMNIPNVGSAYREGYGVCRACGWIGNEKAFGYAAKPTPDPYAVARGMGERTRAAMNAPKPRKKGERLHTMYQDKDGNTVVSDEW